MRLPIFKVVCDDEPLSMDYPCAVSADAIRRNGDFETLAAITFLRVGASITVGGGAAVQFTLGHHGGV